MPLLNAAEKIPFEVTPFYPYLKRAPVQGRPLTARTTTVQPETQQARP